MIVVKIEMWPYGNENKKREIGRMYIANDGEHPLHPKRGNYKVKVCRRGAFTWLGDWAGIVASRVGSVTDYPRESYNVWRLVARALRSTFPEEK